MFGNISYKRKLRALLWGSVVLVLLIYKVVLSKTIELYKESSALENQLVQTQGIPEKLVKLKKQSSFMEEALEKQNSEGMNSQDALLNMVTKYCQENKTILREFPQVVTNEESEMAVQTNVFTVEGEFAKLLNLSYQLEQKCKVGKLRALKFSSKKDPRTNTLTLLAILYVQNIKKINHEK